MVERTYIHITGPPGGGKTTLIERLLEHSPSTLIAARCAVRDNVRNFTETRARNDAELARYRKAGARAVMRYRFEPGLEETDALWDTAFMQEFSEGILFEGDMPARVEDLTVYVTRPLPARKPLLQLVLVDRTRTHRQRLRFLEKLAKRPEGIEELATLMLGNRGMASGLPQELRASWALKIKAIAAKARADCPPPPQRRWVLAKGLAGIERAEVVAVNASSPAERKTAETMIEALQRLRRDEEVFRDILGRRGNRLPILARVADLNEPGDKNLKFLLRRIERTIGARSRSA